MKECTFQSIEAPTPKDLKKLLHKISERMVCLLEREGLYELKTPYRNGTTHVIFEPLDFIARLVTLVPKPRVHLTRFHGVFAPNSKYRRMVTSDAIGRKNKSKATKEHCLEEAPRLLRFKLL